MHTIQHEFPFMKSHSPLPLVPEMICGKNIPITREQILVISKLSRFERDLARHGVSDQQLITRYTEMGESGSQIYASHERQIKALQSLRSELPPQQVKNLAQIAAGVDIHRYKLIISLGGDDFFKQVTHLIDTDLPILGINSDPQASTGALLPTSADSIQSVLMLLESGRYRLEPWTRVRLAIDGKDIGPAINDVVLGKSDFRLMSRHLLEIGDQKVLQKSSGILISTGTGSTGWFTSAGLYLGTDDRSFSKSAHFAHFELREPQISFNSAKGARIPIFPPLVQGLITQGETLRITSLNHEDGVASRDSLDSIPFNRGSVAEITIDSKPLWVVIPEVQQ